MEPSAAAAATPSPSSNEEQQRPLNHDIAEATRAQVQGDSNENVAEEVFRADYRLLRYIVHKVHLNFVLNPGKTTVTTDMFVDVNPDYDPAQQKEGGKTNDDNILVLDGQETDVALWSIVLVKDNGGERELTRGVDYTLEPGKLILLQPKAGTRIRTVVLIVPESNTILEGLFTTGGLYCTQCEADGFRRITYFPDRPDNLALFERVRIEACAQDYPVLLSNGVPIEKGILPNSDNNGRHRHYVVWSDAFPKPSYLFALVAGDLEYIEDTFTTTPSQRQVTLRIYSTAPYVDNLQHAMTSLKKAMKWDEQTFGLECDSELYQVVAVDDFNAGAMENKGLNIFNAGNILADEKNATDEDFERVESIIAHEYFHNWTGNRVTVRDWFQLTLKEGLTVYRDQRFSSDMNSAAVKRIDTVRYLRASQFREDAGPMSHPIRPESYVSMDNFYTSTVYEKGAEVIRMYETLLSMEGFQKGLDLYIQRHDGQAVACDDFLAAMADANDVDLSQFSLWYSTNGTPTVTYSTSYDNGVFSLTLKQESNRDTPLHIPVLVGLIDKESREEVVASQVLELREKKQTFEFTDLKGDVVPSMLRGFSAPVKLVSASGEVDEESLSFLASDDTDGFNRWEAGQKLYTSLIFKTMREEPMEETTSYVCQLFKRILDQQDGSVDYGMQAYAMTLPHEEAIAEEVAVVNLVKIQAARDSIQQLLARKYYAKLMLCYSELTKQIEEHSRGKFLVDATAMGQRHLRNAIFRYLCTVKQTPEEKTTTAELAMEHMRCATGMSDKQTALIALVSMELPARDHSLKQFYDHAEGYNLVVDKWFAAQAMADVPDILVRVKKLMDHEDFSFHRPNRCKALINAFTTNYKAFHHESGSGYQFVGEALADLDRINPKASSVIAARRFIQWRRYDEKRGALLKAELLKLKNLQPKISTDLDEIVTRALS